MGIYRRGATWWISYTTPDGRRIRRSAGTEDRKQAQELYDRSKADSWRQAKLGDRPQRTWAEAVIRWVQEANKRSLECDKMHLRWIAGQWDGGLPLESIGVDKISALSAARQADGVSNATVNRMLAMEIRNHD